MYNVCFLNHTTAVLGVIVESIRNGPYWIRRYCVLHFTRRHACLRVSPIATARFVTDVFLKEEITTSTNKTGDIANHFRYGIVYSCDIGVGVTKVISCIPSEPLGTLRYAS